MSDIEDCCDGLRNLAESQLQFTLELYQQHAASDTGNIFFSPFSISVALAMTYAGARNDTAAQIRDVMKLELVGDDPHVHASFAALLASLKEFEKHGITINNANRIYVQNQASISADYQEILDNMYDSSAANVDFAEDPDSIREEINAWVEEVTNEKIRNLVEEGVISDSTRVVLANAIYFKGDWASKFDASESGPGAFNLSVDDVISTDLMHVSGKFALGYGEDLQCSVLELPYVNGCLSMFIILPNDVDGLPELEGKLTAENLKELLDEMDITFVSVSLPKFRLEATLPALELLNDMGISDLFTEGAADLSGISEEESLSVSALVHKAICEVDEEGSEASAASATVMTNRCILTPIEFKADHPFMFFIRENTSGSILFIGKLLNPEIGD